MHLFSDLVDVYQKVCFLDVNFRYYELYITFKHLEFHHQLLSINFIVKKTKNIILF